MSRKLLSGKDRTTLDIALTNGTIPKGMVLPVKNLNSGLSSRVKYGTIDFFEHFHKKVVSCINDNSEEATKLACIYIPYLVTYFGLSIKEGKEIFPEEIENLFTLKDKMKELLAIFEVDGSEIGRYLDSSSKMVKESFPDKFAELIVQVEESKENQPEQETQNSEIVSQMAKELDAAKKQNERLTKENASLKTDVEKAQKKVEYWKGKKESSDKDIIDKATELKESRTTIKTQKKEIDTLSKQIAALQKEAEQRAEKEQEAIKAKEAEEEKKKNIKEKIIEILISNPYTISNIQHALYICGYDVSKEYVQSCLNELELTFNIEKDNYNIPTTYRIAKKGIAKGKQYKINAPIGGSWETLVMTDVHANLNELDKAKRGINASYDYVAKHGLPIVTNLGDLFELDIPITKTISYNDINDIRKLISEVSKLIPQVKGVKHALLGGNHCKKLLQSGIDPVEELARPREDIIDLGYDEAYLSFGRPTDLTNRDLIALLHTNTKKEVTVFKGQTVRQTVEEFDPKEIAKKNAYFSLMGHTHVGKFYPAEGLFLVPSITRDRLQNGAVHLKINFDSNGLIKSIELLPLANINNKLVQVSSEIEFVRKR